MPSKFNSTPDVHSICAVINSDSEIFKGAFNFIAASLIPYYEISDIQPVATILKQS